MNEYPMTFDSQFRPGDLTEIARSMRRLKLRLDEALLAGPPASYTNRAYELIDAVSPPRDYFQDAADDVLAGKDPSENLKLAAAWSLRPGLAQRISEGGRQAYTDALNVNASEIIKALDQQVVSPAIATMKKLNAKYPDEYWNLEAAVAAQDFQQAQRIKDHATLCQDLKTAYRIRTLLHPDAYDTDAAWAREPGVLEHVGEPEVTDISWWMQVINAGFTPWFPTVQEWQEMDNSDAFKEHREYLDRMTPVVDVVQLGHEER